MIDIQFFPIILLFISETQLSFQLGQGYCRNEITHSYECCYNYENITDVCTECRNGAVSQQGKKCLPCEHNMYGHKCLSECNCKHQQRCDAEVGCVWNTTIATIQEEKYSFSTKTVTTTHLILDSTLRNEMPTNKWILYTLCAVGFLIIIVVSYCVRSYRKRLSINVRSENRREEIEIRQESVEQLNIGIYDDIDDNLVGVDNSGRRLSPQLRNPRAIIDDIRTIKTNSEQEDNSSYLDPHFADNETESRNSLTDSSSNLVVLDHTEYLNPYQPLLGSEQHTSDGYAVPIPVHQNSDRSSESSSLEDGSSAYAYSHVYQQLHRDQSTNTHIYEKATLIVNEFNLRKENENERFGNQVSADKYNINSSNLLYIKETDETINDPVLFVCQTIGDETNSDSFINTDDKDNTDSLENIDTQVKKANKKTFKDENCTEHVRHVGIHNEYLDMQSLTKKNEI